MIIGVISDIHGNGPALKAVLSEIERHPPDALLVAGDLVGYYPYVNEIFELLRAYDPVTVLGNHDCYLLGKIPLNSKRWHDYNLDYVERAILPQNRAWLADHDTQDFLSFKDYPWLLCHGSPWSVEEYIYPDNDSFERFTKLNKKVIVMGHTHIPMVRRIGEKILINPGSCGQPRDYDPRTSYALVDAVTLEVEIHRVPYDVEAVQKRVISEGFNEQLSTILSRRKGQ